MTATSTRHARQAGIAAANETPKALGGFLGLLALEVAPRTTLGRIEADQPISPRSQPFLPGRRIGDREARFHIKLTPT
jgi:hypothetical protein